MNKTYVALLLFVVCAGGAVLMLWMFSPNKPSLLSEQASALTPLLPVDNDTDEPADEPADQPAGKSATGKAAAWNLARLKAVPAVSPVPAQPLSLEPPVEVKPAEPPITPPVPALPEPPTEPVKPEPVPVPEPAPIPAEKGAIPPIEPPPSVVPNIVPPIVPEMVPTPVAAPVRYELVPVKLVPVYPMRVIAPPPYYPYFLHP